MGTQGTGRKRSTKKERSTAEDDALNLIAREAEARLAAKRAARAEAREIRMKELERQQKEIFQVQKKYYGLDTKIDDRSDSKWGDIEQWMEDSERYSRSSRIHTLSDDDERMSVGSRGSVRDSASLKKSKKKKKHKHKDKDRNGYDDEYSVISSRSSRLSDESRVSRSSRLDLTSSRLSDDTRGARSSRLDLQPAAYASSDLYSFNGLSSSRNPGSTFNGYQSSLYEDSLSGSRRATGSSSHPFEYGSYRSSGSRVSSRAGSARTSPVDNCGSVASFLRSAASSSGLHRDLDDVTIPDFPDVEDRDYLEKGSRAASALTGGTLTSLGGTSSRRGSGETAITVDAETSIREIKEIHELKDQIQDVETKYTQNLKEAKDALVEVEEKYRKAMVSNAQLDNEKNNLMYQVDTLKDSLMELEELLSESRRGHEEKVKDYEREKHAHTVLQFQFNEMKETLKQSEELLNDIRQLRLKQEGFVREISDLQETVEWKDKKIGALERQKEYTDAIRIERDELREEVVKLKDILKKHGIVLGPDLNINGEVGVAEVDGTPSADPASQPPQDSLPTPTEGNSMLGNTEETQLRSSGEEEVDPEPHQEMSVEDKKTQLRSSGEEEVDPEPHQEMSVEDKKTQLRSSGEEEVDPEQHQEMFEDAKENHMSSDTLCNIVGVSTLETSSEEQPTEEPQTCLEEDKKTATEEGKVGECGLSKDLNVDINDQSITEAKDVIICSPVLQGIVTSSEEKVPETEMPEGGELGEMETKSSCVGTQSDDIRESCNNLSEEQEDKEEDEERNVRNTESCPLQKVAQDLSKESLPDESVPTVSNTEPQPDKQEPENAEAENDEAEEISSKSQPQGAAASGKKKKRKRRGKKKGGTHEDKNQQKDATEKEKGKTEIDIEPATRDKGPKTEPEVDCSVAETLKESGVDQCKNEQDGPETGEVNGLKSAEPFSPNDVLKESRKDHVADEHGEEETLETVNVEEVEAVVTTETFTLTETLKESRTDHVADEHEKEQTSETENVEEAEAVATAETVSNIETPKEVRVDHVTEERSKEQSLETKTVEAVEAVAPAETFSHVETLKESGADPRKNEQDEEQTLELENVEEAKAVATAKTTSNIETPMEVPVDHVTEERSKEQSLETKTVETVEAVAPAETFSHVETLKESGADPRKNEQDEEQTLELESVKEMGSITSPVPETNIGTSDLIDNSKGPENGDGLDKECTSSVDHSESETDISTKDNVIHTESVSAEVEVGWIDEMKSECTANNDENTFETSNKENAEPESQIPNNDDIAADESESASNSESKDIKTMSLSPTDDFTVAVESLPGLVPPSDLDAAVNSDSGDTPIKVFDKGPEEATETIKDDVQPKETKQESFSPSHDGDDSELKADGTENEELNKGLREPEGLAQPDGSSHDQESDSHDSASIPTITGAFDSMKSLFESVVQMIHTPDSPKEATEFESTIEEEHSTEDPEHKDGQQSETSQVHEPSKDKSEDNDASQPTLQDSDEEDAEEDPEEDPEEDEGLSFDFDDMDVEAAIATSLSSDPKQEEVEEGVEVMSDESNDGSSGQSNTESNENRPDELVESIGEKSTVDGIDALDTGDNQNSLVHEGATSDKGEHVENVCEDQKNTPEEVVAAVEERGVEIIEEVKVLNVEELGSIAEGSNQAMSLPLEEGLDANKAENSPKSAEQVAGIKEPQQTQRDAKKNGKKGKGKGKEECKMS